jgi:PST family polysaccharide transporter
LSTDKERTARSALWSLVENGGLAAISLGTLVIYAHLLSPSAFGLFAVVLSLIEILQVLVTMFFHDALVQRQNVTERHFDTAFSAGMAASLLLAALTCLASPLFAAAVDAPQAAVVLCAMSLCLPFAALSATIVARQRKSFGFRALALRSLIGRVAGAVIGVGLIVGGAGIWGLIAQQVLIQAVGSGYLWAATRERPKLAFGLDELKELARFGAYAVSTLLLGFALKRLFTIAAGMFLGVELAGHLNLAFRTVDVFWAVAATAATQVALPLLASMQRDLPRLRQAFQRATELVCLLLYSAFIGLGLVAPELVEVMFGAKWQASAPYVTALSCLVLVQAPRVLVAPLLTALGRPRDLVVAKAMELAFVVAAVAVTRLPSLGFAVGVWIARELFTLTVTVRQLRDAAGFDLRTQLKPCLMPALCALSMAAVLLVARALLPPGLHPALRLSLLVSLGVIGFGGALLAFDREQVRSLISLLRAAVGRRAAPSAELALSRSP